MGKAKIELSLSPTNMEERVKQNMPKRRSKPIDETFFKD